MAQSGTSQKGKSSGKPRDNDSRGPNEESTPVTTDNVVRKSDIPSATTSDGDSNKPGGKPQTRKKFWWFKDRKNQAASENKDEGPTIAAKAHKEAEKMQYTGRCRGSKPVRKTCAQNIEFSQFVILVREVYELMLKVDYTALESYPFPAFLHYCCTILHAVLLDLAAKNCKYQSLLTERPALEQINADDYFIPTPIYEYIVSIGNSVTPNDEVIAINLPQIAIPRAPFRRAGVDIPSGTFGHIDSNV